MSDNYMSAAPGGGSGGAVNSVTFVPPLYNTGTATDVVGEIIDSTPISAYSATTANITGLVYNNGTSGVGATLTKATAFTQANLGLGTDPIVVGERYLIKNQTAQTQNGIYVLTSNSGTFVLTRATDSDEPSELFPQLVSVSNGTNIGTNWGQRTQTVVIGTSNIVYTTSTQTVYVQEQGTHIVNGVAVGGSAAKTIKEFANFKFDGITATLAATLKQDLTYLTNHYKVEASSDLFGVGAPGVGMYAGPNPIIAPSGSGAAFAAVNSSGNFLAQMTSYTSNYEATATSNGSTGAFSYNAIDKIKNYDSGITANPTQVKINSSNNLTKNNEFLINWTDDTARLRNNANTNEAIHTTLEYNAPQKTAFNWNPGAPQTSTVTHNGSFASNTTYVTADYVVDSNDPLVPDNTLAVFTDIFGGPIAIQMPSAADFLGREIGIYNVGQNMNSIFEVRVSFVGTEFQGVINEDAIMAVPYEFKLYKAVRNSSGSPIWIIKYTNKTLDGYKLYNYDSPAVIACPEDAVTYGFGEDPSTIGSPTLDISSISAPNIPYGTKLTVKDIGNNASVMNINIDAGTDQIIDLNAVANNVLIDRDGGSYTLQKMYNGFNAHTYWMVISKVM